MRGRDTEREAHTQNSKVELQKFLKFLKLR